MDVACQLTFEIHVIIRAVMLMLITIWLVFLMVRFRRKPKQIQARSLKKIMAVLEVLPIPFALHRNNDCIYLNREAKKWFHLYKDPSSSGDEPMNWIAQVQEQYQQSCRHEIYLMSLVDSQRVEKLSIPFQTGCVPRSGHVMWMDLQLNRMVISNKPYVLIQFKPVRSRTDGLEQAERPLQYAGELAAAMAHEIRNPLTTIRGFLQLLQPYYDGKKVYVDLLYDELNRLDVIAESLLQLDPSTVPRLDEVDLRTILQDMMILLQTEASENKISLVLHVPQSAVMVYCEVKSMKQALLNIVRNAVEASPQGETVYITMGVCDAMVQIKIRDCGYGLNEQQLQRLGQPFYRSKGKGTGLSLMMTYNVLEKHGGMIEVQSEVNKGTTFNIQLPFRQPPTNHEKGDKYEKTSDSSQRY
ncbi:ATP-binding protein [Marinicrinis sediminis]|uniref:histidine kinase n=1 Tax=Marinicrinis sediminis TaxID=1652465 RepID=A0ABW5R4T8_9BACL